VSTFLELVVDLHRESGAAGQAPTTVVGQRGEYNRLVHWIKDADMYIQDMYENWKFMRAQYSEDTLAGNKMLPSIQDVAWYDEGTFKIIENGTTDENPIEVVEYDAIKGEIRDTTSNVPYRVIIMPDNTLEVDPFPDAAHTIKCDYYKNAVEMIGNSDISVIPERFHRAILGYALMLYAGYERADEIMKQGELIFGQQIQRLENSQLPNKFNSRFRTGGGFEVIAE
jgi:hypothetical protein